MLPLALLQTLLSRRFLAREEAERCYAALEDAMEERGPGLDDAITLLNERLAGVSLEIRACHDQISRAQFLVLVNTKADTLAELATPYTPTELVYIKAILEAIWTAPQRHYALSSTAALQLAPSLQLSKRAASDLLQDLERRNWIVNRGGYYTMSLRALTELDAYIRNEFEEHVLECIACYALVTRGQQCATEGCCGALHTACKSWLGGGGERACPLCKQPWRGVGVGIEEAAR